MNSPLLWQVMRDAYLCTHAVRSEQFYAAQLRAIALQAPASLKGMTPGNVAVVVNWLMAEAARAEAGE